MEDVKGSVSMYMGRCEGGLCIVKSEIEFIEEITLALADMMVVGRETERMKQGSRVQWETAGGVAMIHACG